MNKKFLFIFFSLAAHIAIYFLFLNNNNNLPMQKGLIQVDIHSRHSYVSSNQAKLAVISKDLKINKQKIKALQEKSKNIKTITQPAGGEGQFKVGIIKIYPLKSRLKKEEGNVLLSFDRVNGKLLNIAIKSSSGYPLLDQAALDSLQLSAQVFTDKLDQIVQYTYKLKPKK